MKNVLIFTDVGVDDAFALIYALKHPDLNVVGIVAGFGNVEKEKAVRNVHYLLNQLGISDVPLISGAAYSLSGDEPTYFEEIHGPSGLGDIETGIEKYTLYNFDLILEIIRKTKNLTIVNLGRLTSLAMVSIISPELIKRIKSIVIMGGAFLVPGNITPYAEANFFADPVAVNVILANTSNKKVTIVPLNITKEAIVTEETISLIKEKAVTNLGTIVQKLYQPYFDFYKKKNPDLKGAPLHDLATVMYLTKPEIFKGTFRNVMVDETSYLTSGVSVADFRSTPEVNKEANNYSKIILEMNYPKFITEFTKTTIGEI